MIKKCGVLLIWAGMALTRPVQDINSYIENPAMVAENQEPAHVPLMPFPDAQQAKSLDWSTSPFYHSLDGQWAFKWVPRPEQVPCEFYQADYPDQGWDRIAVPGTWQMQGYDHIIYRNIPMELTPYDPPRVPDVFNPTGCYRRTFKVPESWQGRQILLHFDGVQAASFVWVNGRYVGYDEDGMTDSEYNITPYVKSGDNTLAVQVLRWCDGSYLEDQDMWRFSGIYRSAYLFAVPSLHMRDYFIKTDLDAERRKATLSIDVETVSYSGAMPDLYAIQAEVIDPDGKPVAQWKTTVRPKSGPVSKHTLKQAIDAPKLWSDEKPYRYTLIVSLLSAKDEILEALSQKFGIRTITVANGQLLVNGRAVDFKGVNRHEHHPDLGRTMTLEMMHKDARLMKQFNINAVRHSHYPNDPRWYEICDEYGIYICDEVNAECHYGQEYLADTPGWEAAFMDRFEHMVQRAKNSCSVIFWSTGNECGLGQAHYLMADYARRVDPTRVLYHQSNRPDGEAPFVDVLGPRYPTPASLRLIGSGPGKPVVMGEYAHAMENSLGHFDEFWQVIHDSPRLQGGFVWDWVDQGLRQTRVTTPNRGHAATEAVYFGRPQTVAGQSGQAIALSGIDDWVELYDDPALDITGSQLTVCARLYPRGFYSSNPIVAKGDHQFGLLQSDEKTLEFYIQDQQKRIAVTGPVPANWDFNWHTVTGVYNGSALVLYLDGKPLAEQPYAGQITSCRFPVNIGRNAELHHEQFQGWISNAIFDHVRLYDRVLTAEEIKALPVAPDAHTRLWLDFDESASQGDYFGYGSSNFLINGVIFADRTPQPELWQMKKSHEPISVRAVDLHRGELEITNRFAFTSLEEIDAGWRIEADGEILQQGTLSLSAGPQKSQPVRVPYAWPQAQPSTEYWLMLTFRIRKAQPGLEAGHEWTFAQFKLPTAAVAAPAAPAAKSSAKIIRETQRLVIAFPDRQYVFDKKSGRLIDLSFQGQDLLDAGPQLNLWRAPISNEYVDWGTAEVRDMWAAGLDRMEHELLSINSEELENGRIHVIVSTRSQAKGIPEGYDNTYSYLFMPSGEVCLTHKAIPFGRLNVDWLPKMGLQLRMPESFQSLSWYGKGPFETYPDRNSGAKIAVYSGTVADQYVPYTRPMEQGNKTEVRWLAMTNEAGFGLVFVAMPEMNVSVTLFDNWDRARHPFQLLKCGAVIVNLDHQVTGVGDTPNPVLPQYRTYPQAFEYSVKMAPFSLQQIKPAQLAKRIIPLL